MRKHLIKEQEATTDNKAPMHAEIKEIREWHKLCGMYLNRPKELQVKRLHELSDKWMPIDTTQMLFDYIDKLQSRLEKCEETLKLIRGYAYTMGEGNIIAERINEYFA